MNKHTPGPWSKDNQAGSSSVQYGHVYADSWPDRMVADVYGENQVQISANARLIAAAPELLAALEHMLGACDPTVDRADDEYFDYADAYIACDAARAAIAKARWEA